MQTREELFWNLYHEERHMDQLKWYKGRQVEFEQAQTQAELLTIVLMALASLVSVLGSINVGGIAEWWGVLAIIFPVLATALATYVSVYAFERQAKLYQDAIDGLREMERFQANLRLDLPDAQYASALKGYVGRVEFVFTKEGGQWGQLVSEIKGASLPGSTPQAGGGGD